MILTYMNAGWSLGNCIIHVQHPIAQKSFYLMFEPDTYHQQFLIILSENLTHTTTSTERIDTRFKNWMKNIFHNDITAWRTISKKIYHECSTSNITKTFHLISRSYTYGQPFLIILSKNLITKQQLLKELRHISKTECNILFHNIVSA